MIPTCGECGSELSGPRNHYVLKGRHICGACLDKLDPPKRAHTQNSQGKAKPSTGCLWALLSSILLIPGISFFYYSITDGTMSPFLRIVGFEAGLFCAAFVVGPLIYLILRQAFESWAWLRRLTPVSRLVGMTVMRFVAFTHGTFLIGVPLMLLRGCRGAEDLGIDGTLYETETYRVVSVGKRFVESTGAGVVLFILPPILGICLIRWSLKQGKKPVQGPMGQ